MANAEGNPMNWEQREDNAHINDNVSEDFRAQLLRFVNSLTSEYTAMDKHARQIIIKAEQEATAIKLEAIREAEEMKKQAEKIMSSAMSSSVDADTLKKHIKKVHQDLVEGLGKIIDEMENISVEWDNQSPKKRRIKTTAHADDDTFDDDGETRRKINAQAARAVAEAQAITERAAKNLLISAAQRAAELEIEAKEEVRQKITGKQQDNNSQHIFKNQSATTTKENDTVQKSRVLSPDDTEMLNDSQTDLRNTNSRPGAHSTTMKELLAWANQKAAEFKTKPEAHSGQTATSNTDSPDTTAQAQSSAVIKETEKKTDNKGNIRSNLEPEILEMLNQVQMHTTNGSSQSTAGTVKTTSAHADPGQSEIAVPVHGANGNGHHYTPEIDQQNAETIAQAVPSLELEDDFELPVINYPASEYQGELTISIEPPVDEVHILKLYRCLRKIPQLKILRTIGSWSKGTSIIINLERVTPLVAILSEFPWVEKISEQERNGIVDKIVIKLQKTV